MCALFFSFVVPFWTDKAFVTYFVAEIKFLRSYSFPTPHSKQESPWFLRERENVLVISRPNIFTWFEFQVRGIDDTRMTLFSFASGPLMRVLMRCEVSRYLTWNQLIILFLGWRWDVINSTQAHVSKNIEEPIPGFIIRIEKRSLVKICWTMSFPQPICCLRRIKICG